jgi:hypothetical protein
MDSLDFLLASFEAEKPKPAEAPQKTMAASTAPCLEVSRLTSIETIMTRLASLENEVRDLEYQLKMSVENIDLSDHMGQKSVKDIYEGEITWAINKRRQELSGVVSQITQTCNVKARIVL